MRQDAPRHDVDPDDRLSDFDSEVQNPAFDKNESDIAFHTHEHGAARDGSESGAIYDSRELDLAVGRKEPDGAFGRENLDTVFNKQRDITSGTRKGDIQPDAHVRPVQAPSVQPFARYTSGPVVHKSARRNLGIALLVLASIVALAWSGRWLMGMRRDAGTSGGQILTASQPAPTVPREAPTNVLPPAPGPQHTRPLGGHGHRHQRPSRHCPRP